MISMTGTIKTENGVQLKLVSKEKLSDMGQMEKIRYILDAIKDNTVVILESGLSPDEEGKLVERTMHEINDDFSGIEIESYAREESSSGLMSKLLSRNDRQNRLTVIGPANKMETLHKDDSLIETLVK